MHILLPNVCILYGYQLADHIGIVGSASTLWNGIHVSNLPKGSGISSKIKQRRCCHPTHAYVSRWHIFFNRWFYRYDLHRDDIVSFSNQKQTLAEGISSEADGFVQKGHCASWRYCSNCNGFVMEWQQLDEPYCFAKSTFGAVLVDCPQ